MELISTQDPDHRVSLQRAVLQSLPADGGLYMPSRIPRLSDDFWRRLPQSSFQELSHSVLDCLIGDALPPGELQSIVDGALSFDAPVVPVAEHMSVLELFHGPTLAFKDFGARFMARLMRRLHRKDDPLTVLVATSGDTGAAVAAGFHGVEGIEVFVLYPHQRVSPLQEKQLTTWGDNIRALEVEGTFDDCQRLVKTAFLDSELRRVRTLTSANSINIARLLPQTLYYFRAWQQMTHDRPVVFSVPSGNLGNLTAGLLAKRMGLPVHRFIAAQNANDAFDRFLATGVVPERTAVATHSNAMDVARPSNLVRIVDLYRGQDVRRDVASASVGDDATLATMAEVHGSHRMTLCPHTAVGWAAAERYRATAPEVHAVVLATAHPAKFPDPVQRATGHVPTVPERLLRMAARTKQATRIGPAFSPFKDLLMQP
jgi:threonine synthase